MKFFSKCHGCRKRKFIVRRRPVFIPKIGEYATSQNLICRKCARAVQKAIQ